MEKTKILITTTMKEFFTSSCTVAVHTMIILVNPSKVDYTLRVINEQDPKALGYRQHAIALD